MKFTLLTEDAHLYPLRYLSAFYHLTSGIFENKVQSPIALHGIIYFPMVEAICSLA